MTRRRSLLALGLVVLWCALGAAGVTAQPDRVIVAFGDSLTAGHGVGPDQSYPALLGSKLRTEGYSYRVINAGVSGDTTAGGLRRVDWALKNRPDIVLLELGANDAFRGQDLDRVRANLDAMPFFLDGVGAVARLNQADGIHPTAEGYRIIVERLWPYLEPLLRRER